MVPHPETHLVGGGPQFHTWCPCAFPTPPGRSSRETVSVLLQIKCKDHRGLWLCRRDLGPCTGPWNADTPECFVGHSHLPARCTPHSPGPLQPLPPAPTHLVPHSPGGKVFMDGSLCSECCCLSWSGVDSVPLPWEGLPWGASTPLCLPGMWLCRASLPHRGALAVQPSPQEGLSRQPMNCHFDLG